jgi:Na+/H+ antiporter NhaD/arsenite permease-like protein
MTVERSYRAINWTTVILVGALMPLSTAMVETGAAKLMAERSMYVVGNAGPWALLAGLFVLTAIMGQLISNTPTALIVTHRGGSCHSHGDLAPSGTDEHGGSRSGVVPVTYRAPYEP